VIGLEYLSRFDIKKPVNVFNDDPTRSYFCHHSKKLGKEMPLIV